MSVGDDRQLLLKAIGGLVVLMLGGLCWYIRSLTVEVSALRAELAAVHRQVDATAMALELELGGDPFRND